MIYHIRVELGSNSLSLLIETWRRTSTNGKNILRPVWLKRTKVYTSLNGSSKRVLWMWSSDFLSDWKRGFPMCNLQVTYRRVVPWWSLHCSWHSDPWLSQCSDSSASRLAHPLTNPKGSLLAPAESWPSWAVRLLVFFSFLFFKKKIQSAFNSHIFRYV